MDITANSSIKGNILIVDDTPANLRLLSEMLAGQGYETRPIPNGTLALKAIEADLPDLILLDVNMPDITGYALCETLKKDEKTRKIPIIFISAMDEVVDKVKAFSVGGVDYITKPFHVEEVLARVETHLTLRKLYQDIEKSNTQLSKSNASLQIANHELDAFAQTVAHDLKNPLGIITGFTDLLVEDLSVMDKEQIGRTLKKLRDTGEVMFNIIEELLLLASVRKEAVTPIPIDMTSIVMCAKRRLSLLIKTYQPEFIFPNTWPIAQGHPAWIEEVWVNYLSNALKYGGTPPRLELGAAITEDGMVRYWVRDNGPGLAPEAQQKLFTEFTRLHHNRAKGHGLGLSIVRRIVEKLNGEVGIESTLGEGSLFYFTLPPAFPPK